MYRILQGRTCGFGQSLGRPIVRSISHFLKKTGQKIQESEQKYLRLDKFFFVSPKKLRNRPDNWSTKRLTKTTWTGLMPVAEIYYPMLHLYNCWCISFLYFHIQKYDLSEAVYNLWLFLYAFLTFLIKST